MYSQASFVAHTETTSRAYEVIVRQKAEGTRPKQSASIADVSLRHRRQFIVVQRLHSYFVFLEYKIGRNLAAEEQGIFA